MSKPQTATKTYDLDRETLRAAWACATQEEVKGIIRVNGRMVSKPVLKQLKAIARDKPKTKQYVQPQVSAVPRAKGCSEGPDYIVPSSGVTSSSEANWLNPWGK